MTSGSDWTGAVGDAWAAEWRRTDRSLADLARHLDAAILAAAPAGRFRALDIGCGAGSTSLVLAAARPDAEIVAVDLSAGLVEIARNRAGQRTVRPRQGESRAGGDVLDNPGLSSAREHAGDEGVVELHIGDAVAAAQDSGPFDLLHSRHGVMFFDDPVAAFAGLLRSAAPSARLVFSCFRDWLLNGFACEVAASIGGAPPAPGPGPFAFADADRTARMLADAGWAVEPPAAIDFAYRVGVGDDPVAEALSFLQRIGPAASVLREADSDRRAALLDRVRVVVEAHRTGGTVDFPAAAWIWSVKAPSERAVP